MSCYSRLRGGAGPELTTFTSQLSPKELLSSLILPNDRIAPGYGMISLILKDGSEIDGLLISEESRQLNIRDAQNEVKDVAVTNISERVDAVSGMPDMTRVLTKIEIRDLMAYLVGCKGE